ncbi:uncharacterized protein LOC117303909 [Asterias rubens]|uniref:uncharacterized protein LOC117296003 n=1 Tax=Asterias rubens TaxID=7604 RepID=UPI0014552081|nr:uncharacterized protein LOC117296003 [Asterias rubens]XP_033644252.1 uncharacterized protein LOC117303909 [Asterias rubens]
MVAQHCNSAQLFTLFKNHYRKIACNCHCRANIARAIGNFPSRLHAACSNKNVRLLVRVNVCCWWVMEYEIRLTCMYTGLHTSHTTFTMDSTKMKTPHILCTSKWMKNRHMCLQSLK